VYPYSWGCGVCAPDYVYVDVFIDLDADETRDPDEPWGMLADEPLVEPLGTVRRDLTIDRIGD
jgi:hypothetical protein